MLFRLCIIEFLRIFSLLVECPTQSGQMFAVRASYLSLLQSVAARCGLPYASVVLEMAGDGSPVYGVEVDVPCAGSSAPCRSFFFWAAGDGFSGPAYEQAALEAITFLQKMYGFVIVDYNFQGLLMYRRVAGAAVSVAARAVGMVGRLARERQELAMQCDYFMREISLLSLLV